MPLRLWHLLSLDAPTVAAVWACLLAHAAGVRPSLSAGLVLIMGTWLLYVADRLLDARAGSDPFLLRERHYFAAGHRRRFVVAGLVVGVALAWLIMRMSWQARILDAVIFLAAMVYFVAVHAPVTNRWLPKELAVAILFAGATAVPAWSQLVSASTPRLGPAFATLSFATLAFATAIFAAICWLNCVAIDHWEADESGSHKRGVSGTGLQRPGQPSRQRFRQPLRHRLSSICAGVSGFVLAATPAFLIFAKLQAVAPVLLSAAASALLLLLLEQRRRHLSRMQLRIFADTALLTPLLLLVLLKWQ